MENGILIISKEIHKFFDEYRQHLEDVDGTHVINPLVRRKIRKALNKGKL